MEVGNGRAEGSSAIGDRGQTAVSLMPNPGTHVHIFESLQLEALYVGSFLYSQAIATVSALFALIPIV